MNDNDAYRAWSALEKLATEMYEQERKRAKIQFVPMEDLQRMNRFFLPDKVVLVNPAPVVHYDRSAVPDIDISELNEPNMYDENYARSLSCDITSEQTPQKDGQFLFTVQGDPVPEKKLTAMKEYARKLHAKHPSMKPDRLRRKVAEYFKVKLV